MITEKTKKSRLPRTLSEFKRFEAEDGFKYEWNDGELIKFSGMNKTQAFIYDNLSKLFSKLGFWKQGNLFLEYDVWLSGIQMRRPDIAYLSNEQIEKGRKGEEVIPKFMCEILSGNDKIYKVEDKIIEYFKAGVKIVWLIYPDQKNVHVYSSRKEVKICTENDVCSANSLLDGFEITVNELFQ
jgi:Uma2 family endonuclease